MRTCILCIFFAKFSLKRECFLQVDRPSSEIALDDEEKQKLVNDETVV